MSHGPVTLDRTEQRTPADALSGDVRCSVRPSRIDASTLFGPVKGNII